MKAPGFLDNRHIKVVRLSTIRTGRLYPQEYRKVESTPGKWTCQMSRKKSPVTRPGINPGTFRLVAQCLRSPGGEVFLGVVSRNRQRKRDILLGTWNVRSLYRAGALLEEVGGDCGDWMERAQDRDRWRALVSTVMKFRVP
jgi:hypothetical protein